QGQRRTTHFPPHSSVAATRAGGRLAADRDRRMVDAAGWSTPLSRGPVAGDAGPDAGVSGRIVPRVARPDGADGRRPAAMARDARPDPSPPRPDGAGGHV